MKWYIKVLQHYADFSGRACRKQYWMFVAFSAVFSLAWQFLWVILFAIKDTDIEKLSIISLMAPITYSVIIMLPALAVTVRRLHDLGKSGWMALVGLIPFIGGFWIFILMLLEGQDGENKYGQNPKTGTEEAERGWQLKSAGTVLVIASVAVIFSVILDAASIHLSYGASVNVLSIVLCFIYLLQLNSGRLLLKRDNRHAKEGNVKHAMMQFLAATTLLAITSVIPFTTILSHKDVPNIVYVNFAENTIFYLAMAFFISTCLFAPQYHRPAKTLTIAISAFDLLLAVYNGMNNIFLFGVDDVGTMVRMIFQQYNIVHPIAFIIVAATLSQNKK